MPNCRADAATEEKSAQITTVSSNSDINTTIGKKVVRAASSDTTNEVHEGQDANRLPNSNKNSAIEEKTVQSSLTNTKNLHSSTKPLVDEEVLHNGEADTDKYCASKDSTPSLRVSSAPLSESGKPSRL